MKHPKGMYVIAITEMWERFSFYIFVSILVLFMMQVLGFTPGFSTFLYGIILATTYLFQVVAGYITDKYISNRKSIVIGGILMFVSQLIFTYDASLFHMTANIPEHSALLFNYPEIVFLIGILFMTIGTGFFKVSVTSFVGLFYEDKEELLDSAYTIFYTFINIGGFFAPFVLNFIVGVDDPSLYQYGFLAGAVIILIGTVMFVALRRYLSLPDGKPVGTIPISKNKEYLAKKISATREKGKKLTKIEKDRLWVIVFALIVITLFYMALEQNSTALIIFNMNYVNNIVPFTNIAVSPEIFLSLPPLFVIIISPIFLKFLEFLSKRDMEPSTISKFAIGLFITALSFVMLLIPLYSYDEVNKINMIWVVMFAIFIVIGELFVMPISLSLISKLAPVKYTSLMMGIMFAATAASEILAGLFASALPSTMNGESLLFNFVPIHGVISFIWVFIIILTASALIWTLCRGKIKKLMHGVT